MIDELATRFFAAIEAGDSDAVRACMTPDAAIWHNTDGVEQTVDQVMNVLGFLAANVDGLRYDEVRRDVFADGFVEQHVLRGTLGNGRAVDIPACIVAKVVDGVIVRIDEYLDQKTVEATFSPS